MSKLSAYSTPILLNKPFWLAVATFFVFLPSLFNDFSGDDAFFLTANSFYEHPRNISRIFSKDYNTIYVRSMLNNSEDMGSGSVAYRPVVTLAFFADKFVWGNHPYGYHLTNLFFHIANVLLVYFLIEGLFAGAGFLAAFLFSIHPIQVEAVCSIGFRSDLLATFWCLVSFWCWRIFRDRRSVAFYSLSSLAFFLAVFSKESAAPLVVVLFFYDKFVIGPKAFRHRYYDYAAHILMLLFYFYVYFFIFQNSELTNSPMRAPSLIVQEILTNLNLYFRAIFWPYDITIWPSLYQPPLQGAWMMILTVLLSLISGVYLYLKEKAFFFFWIWFCVFYVPISGIIPIPNPAAHRFMYLPGIGIWAISSCFLGWFVKNGEPSRFLAPWVRMLIPALLVSLVICSIPLMFIWKNNFTLGKYWSDHFPSNMRGPEYLGKQYLSRGLIEAAIPEYVKSIQLGNLNPTMYLELSMAYLKKGDFEKALEYIQQVNALFPDFSNGHFFAATVYKMKGDYTRALTESTMALELSEQKNVSQFFQVADCTRKLGLSPEKVLKQAKMQLMPAAYEKLMKYFNVEGDNKSMPGNEIK